MTRLQVLKSIMREIYDNTDLPTEDYTRVWHSLSMSYGAGFNDGWRSRVSSKNIPVKQMLNGKVIDSYDSAAEAARAMRTHRTCILDACTGKRKTCKGFEWKQNKNDGKK